MYTLLACSVRWYFGHNIIAWNCLGIGVVGLKKTVNDPGTVSIIRILRHSCSVLFVYDKEVLHFTGEFRRPLQIR